MNEGFCLLANYHLLTFTDWVGDGSARETMGWSLITVTLLTVVVNFLLTSMNSATGIGRIAKLHWKRCLVMRKLRFKKKQAFIESQKASSKSRHVRQQSMKELAALNLKFLDSQLQQEDFILK